MTEQKIKMINTELPDVVELHGVKQIYDGKPPTLEDVNLLIEATPNQGQFIVLLGPSGCGKSTLLRYIAGLQVPTEGQVLIHAKPRTENDRVGMVFQQYSSYPWLTVWENVAPISYFFNNSIANACIIIYINNLI